jgi:hypothetical protein
MWILVLLRETDYCVKIRRLLKRKARTLFGGRTQSQIVISTGILSKEIQCFQTALKLIPGFRNTVHIIFDSFT